MATLPGGGCQKIVTYLFFILDKFARQIKVEKMLRGSSGHGHQFTDCC